MVNYTAFQLTRPVTSCSLYFSRDLPSLGELREIAWEITSKGEKGSRRIGFISPEDRRKAGIGYAGNVYVFNNTVVDCRHGYENGDASSFERNNIATHSEVADYMSASFTVNTTHNLSGDFTAVGYDTLVNQSVVYVDYGGDNFLLSVSDNTARDSGTDLSSGSGFNFDYDIVDKPRPYNSTWDRGASEFNPNVSVPISGFSTNASLGTLTTSLSISPVLTGFSSTAQLGSLAVVSSVAINLTGFGTAAQLGSLEATSSAIQTLAGFSTEVQLGSLDVFTSVNDSAELTGFSSTSALGTLDVLIGIDAEVNLVGFGTLSSLGDLSVTTTGDIFAELTGFSSTVQLGELTVRQSAVVNLTGFSSSAQLGTLFIPVSVAVTGFSSTVQLGVLNVSVSNTVNLTGFSSDVELGDLEALELALTFIQTLFRVRNDDGSETTATWYKGEAVSITLEQGSNKRIRIQIDSKSKESTEEYQLEYRPAGSSEAFMILKPE